MEIDEETGPDFLRRKAIENGHTMTGWDGWDYDDSDTIPEWDQTCTCADCGAQIKQRERCNFIYDGDGKYVGMEMLDETEGTAHTTPCATYHLHYSTMFPFLPKPRKSILNKTKKERTQR